MAGIPVTQNDVNFKVGQLAIDLRTRLADVRVVKRWFDDHNDAALLALGFTQADVDLLRLTVNDLDTLARIATAEATQAQANDFFFHARNVVGLN